MNPELQALLDSIEADVQRVRNMDPALKMSIVAKLDQARALDKGPAMDLPKAISFDGLVEYGRANGANIVNGMPWSFTYMGHPVTHENDQCYLIGSEGKRFTPDSFLVVSKSGKLIFFAD